jgi:hypothetical protein
MFERQATVASVVFGSIDESAEVGSGGVQRSSAFRSGDTSKPEISCALTGSQLPECRLNDRFASGVVAVPNAPGGSHPW